MGGSIGYEPGPDGRGSIFWVEVPLRPTQDAPAPAPAEPDPITSESKAAGCILVVDDVESNRLLARAMLDAAGYVTEGAETGSEAVERVRIGGVALVLMDVRMPGMDGLQATRRIRALPGPASRVPVFALTADVIEEQVRACFDAGMNGHIAKPVDAPSCYARSPARLPKVRMLRRRLEHDCRGPVRAGQSWTSEQPPSLRGLNASSAGVVATRLRPSHGPLLSAAFSPGTDRPDAARGRLRI